MHAHFSPVCEVFFLADFGFDGEEITAAFTVGEEGGLPFAPAGFDGDAHGTEALGQMFGEGPDVTGHALRHGHEVPASLAGIFPQLARETECKIDQSL